MRRSNARGRRFVPARGFTLVELLVGLTLLGLVSTAFYGINRETQQSLSRGERRTDMQQSGRAAMQAVVEELRNASGLMTIGANSVTFVSDRYIAGQERTLYRDDGDYDHDGSTSELLVSRTPNDDGSPGPAVEEIADGIYSLGYRYFGDGTGSSAGDQVTSPIAVRRVEISLGTETAPSGTAGRRTITLTSHVLLRCQE